MSSAPPSSLASLAVPGHRASSPDSKESGEPSVASGGVSGGHGDDSKSASGTSGVRMAALLERLVDRVERLEASRVVPSRSVRDRPPTPAAASSAASLSLSAGLPGSSSMSAFLSGGARRVPATSVSAHVPVVSVDSDSEDEVDPAPAPQAVSSAAREHPLYVPLAPSIIQDVGKAGFQAWMRAEAPKEEWTKLRNRNECEVLAQALDALVVDRDSEAAIEILARRFVGVKHADKSGNWHFADVLAKDMPKRTLLRPSVLSCVLREAKNLTLLESGGYRGTQAGGSSSGRGGDRGRDDDHQSYRGGRGAFRARGGRSAQPNSGGGGGGRGSHGQANTNSNATSSSATSAAGGGSSQGAGRGGNGQ